MNEPHEGSNSTVVASSSLSEEDQRYFTLIKERFASNPRPHHNYKVYLELLTETATKLKLKTTWRNKIVSTNHKELINFVGLLTLAEENCDLFFRQFLRDYGFGKTFKGQAFATLLTASLLHGNFECALVLADAYTNSTLSDDLYCFEYVHDLEVEGENKFSFLKSNKPLLVAALEGGNQHCIKLMLDLLNTEVKFKAVFNTVESLKLLFASIESLLRSEQLVVYFFDQLHASIIPYFVEKLIAERMSHSEQLSNVRLLRFLAIRIPTAKQEIVRYARSQEDIKLLIQLQQASILHIDVIDILRLAIKSLDVEIVTICMQHMKAINLSDAHIDDKLFFEFLLQTKLRLQSQRSTVEDTNSAIDIKISNIHAIVDLLLSNNSLKGNRVILAKSLIQAVTANDVDILARLIRAGAPVSKELVDECHDRTCRILLMLAYQAQQPSVTPEELSELGSRISTRHRDSMFSALFFKRNGVNHFAPSQQLPVASASPAQAAVVQRPLPLQHQNANRDLVKSNFSSNPVTLVCDTAYYERLCRLKQSVLKKSITEINSVNCLDVLDIGVILELIEENCDIYLKDFFSCVKLGKHFKSEYSVGFLVHALRSGRFECAEVFLDIHQNSDGKNNLSGYVFTATDVAAKPFVLEVKPLTLLCFALAGGNPRCIKLILDLYTRERCQEEFVDQSDQARSKLYHLCEQLDKMVDSQQPLVDAIFEKLGGFVMTIATRLLTFRQDITRSNNPAGNGMFGVRLMGYLASRYSLDNNSLVESCLQREDTIVLFNLMVRKVLSAEALCGFLQLAILKKDTQLVLNILTLHGPKIINASYKNKKPLDVLAASFSPAGDNRALEEILELLIKGGVDVNTGTRPSPIEVAANSRNYYLLSVMSLLGAKVAASILQTCPEPTSKVILELVVKLRSVAAKAAATSPAASPSKQDLKPSP